MTQFTFIVGTLALAMCGFAIVHFSIWLGRKKLIDNLKTQISNKKLESDHINVTKDTL
ncbi:MAG: hypothetical protein LBS60_14595 [Deltaproteobacteria bacterium]|jgi:hypothetical protein|nr:hypothetical protein [Deltaproteobacteria bacterium]